MVSVLFGGRLDAVVATVRHKNLAAVYRSVTWADKLAIAAALASEAILPGKVRCQCDNTMIVFVTYIHYARGDAHRLGKCKLAICSPVRGVGKAYAPKQRPIGKA